MSLDREFTDAGWSPDLPLGTSEHDLDPPPRESELYGDYQDDDNYEQHDNSR